MKGIKKMNSRRAFIKGVFATIISAPFLSVKTSKAVNFMSQNPYYDEFDILPYEYKRHGEKLIDNGTHRFKNNEYESIRKKLATKYSWAVPTATAIKKIVEFSSGNKILDFGAGSGYWAALVEDYGGKVECIDNWSDPRPANLYHSVITGSYEMLKNKQDYCLMMVFPPDRRQMAIKALTKWEGKKLIYVGEPFPRATADPNFFAELNNGRWKMTDRIQIPQWYNLADELFLIEKK